MTTLRLFILVALLSVVSGCNHSVRSRGFTRTSTNGVVYSCEIAHLDSAAVPIILLACVGGPGKDYSFTWESHADGRMFVDGTSLAVVSQPTAYYKENGRLKRGVVSESGVWLPLLRKNGPTTEELARAFNEIETVSP